jgi:peptidase M48-like protein
MGLRFSPPPLRVTLRPLGFKLLPCALRAAFVAFVCCFAVCAANAKKVPLRDIPPAANGAFNDLLNATEPAAGDEIPGIWKLLITDRTDMDAHTDQKGTIWVEGGLADLLGNDRGLWAAILAHEVAHNLHKRNQLVGLFPVLGARVQRRDESVADAGGMLLMAKAGYHPLFMLEAQQLLRLKLGEHSHLAAFFGYHPRWDTRVGEVQKNLKDSELEFDKHWPDVAKSPGGPVFVPYIRHVNAVNQQTFDVNVECLGTPAPFSIKIAETTIAGSCSDTTRVRVVSPLHGPIVTKLLDANGREVDQSKTVAVWH